MHTYRELFRSPEFTPLFLTSAGQVAGSTVSGLALGTLVYAATGSPLLSALSMFGPSLAQLIGATTLLSAADRLPPRAALTGTSLLFGVSTAALAIPGLPVWAAFVIVGVQGLVNSLVGGVRYGLLNEILPQEDYLLGRSVLNMSVGIMQICGFAAGGLLIATLSVRGALLAGAVLYLAGTVIARLGLRLRPPRTAGRPSIKQTWHTNALLLGGRTRSYVYLALWVPNGLIVGCESLFVAYSPRHAGLLFASAAAGMLAGDTLAGRFVPARWRRRLGAPMRFLLAAPYLVFALHPALPAAAAAIALASVGYCASLLLQERLMELTPSLLSGHALGLQGSGMLAMQGVGAAIAGAIAQQTAPATAMTVMAAMSVAVTLALAPGLRLGSRTDPESSAPVASGKSLDPQS
ncbi:MAG TPA: MFS transporter [Streptosporangiaceae bacterium]|nr:MFS transporter [Streptosporangiaceae bacterium]